MDFADFFDNVFGTQVNIGDTVWICHFGDLSIVSKYNVIIRPQEVVIVDTFTAYGHRKKSFSDIHFIPVSSFNDEERNIITPMSKNEWTPTVYVFLTEKECVEGYLKDGRSRLASINHFLSGSDEWHADLKQEILDAKAACPIF